MSQLLVLMGFLGRDPVMQYTEKGTAVTNFSVASDDYVGKDETGKAITKATWFHCTAWNDTAEQINKYFKSGMGIYIEGVLNTDPRGNPKVFTRQDGTYGASLDVTVKRWQFVPVGKQDVSRVPENVPNTSDEPEALKEEEKPIPF